MIGQKRICPWPQKYNNRQYVNRIGQKKQVQTVQYLQYIAVQTPELLQTIGNLLQILDPAIDTRYRKHLLNLFISRKHRIGSSMNDVAIVICLLFVYSLQQEVVKLARLQLTTYSFALQFYQKQDLCYQLCNIIYWRFIVITLSFTIRIIIAVSTITFTAIGSPPECARACAGAMGGQGLLSQNMTQTKKVRNRLDNGTNVIQ